MQTVKQIIHDIADHLPEQATFDDAMYALYLRQKATALATSGGGRQDNVTGRDGKTIPESCMVAAISRGGRKSRGSNSL